MVCQSFGLELAELEHEEEALALQEASSGFFFTFDSFLNAMQFF